MEIKLCWLCFLSKTQNNKMQARWSMAERVRGVRFSLHVAWRYLFSRKSHNAVNVITGISSAGIAVGAMAMVCVMSVFNGIESLVSDMFSSFDPDLKITAVEGKTFSLDSAVFDQVRRLPGVEVFTEVVEENALVSFRDKHIPATVKGVDEQCFRRMTRIDSILFDGEFVLFDGGFERIVPGVGVASALGLGAHFIDPVYLYAPKRTARVNMLRPETSFNRVPTFVSGIFMVQQQPYDDSYVLVSLRRARELFEYDDRTVSAVELKLADGASVDAVKGAVRQVLGEGFAVKDRYEQQESFFKIMKMEKWITYLFLSLILLIASFNILGSLSMLIIEKQADIATLRNLGADRRLIKRIFLFEGWLISLVGAVAGMVLGTVLCLAQQHFGFLRMGNNYITEAYPVVVHPGDVLLVLVTVAVMGFAAAYWPVRYIRSEQLKIEN